MKLLVVFATALAVAFSYPTVKTWSLNDLSGAIEKSEGDPEMRKYLIDALNQIMYALFTGVNEKEVHAMILSPSGNRKWTLGELKRVLNDIDPSDTLRPFYQRSYHYLLQDNHEEDKDGVEVIIPALDVSTWSVTDVSDAMEDPDTKPALRPFLEKAKEEIKKELEAGIIKESVILVTPVGLIPGVDASQPTIIAARNY